MAASSLISYMTISYITIALLLLLLLIAVATDIVSHRIPNELIVTMLICGFVLNLWDHGFSGILHGLSGMAVALVVFLPFYILRGMGAGDVKLAAAAGAFLGAYLTLIASGIALLAGSLMAIAVLFARSHRGFHSTLHRYGDAVKSIIFSRQFNYVPPAISEVASQRFPYAPAIAVGFIFALIWHSGALGPSI